MLIGPIGLSNTPKINFNGNVTRKSEIPVEDSQITQKKSELPSYPACASNIANVSKPILTKEKTPDEILRSADRIIAYSQDTKESSENVLGNLRYLASNGTRFYPDGTIFLDVEKDRHGNTTITEFSKNAKEPEREITLMPDGSAIMTVRKKQNDNSTTISEEYGFKFGELIEYSEGVEKLPDGETRKQKQFLYENGKLKSYTKEFHEPPYFSNTMLEAKEKYCFKDGTLTRYLENMQALSDGTVESTKDLKF